MEKKIYSSPLVEIIEVSIENDLLMASPEKLPVSDGENGQGYNAGEIIDL